MRIECPINLMLEAVPDRRCKLVAEAAVVRWERIFPGEVECGQQREVVRCVFLDDPGAAFHDLGGEQEVGPSLRAGKCRQRLFEPTDVEACFLQNFFQCVARTVAG